MFVETHNWGKAAKFFQGLGFGLEFETDLNSGQLRKDRVGLQLVRPEDDWRDRPDMDPHATAGFRASIVAQARYIEDVVAERAEHGAFQYVILGAGPDTFAQRRADLAARVRVFEVDQAGTQEWKRRRLGELGYGVPDGLRFVPSDFEVAGRWGKELLAAGFDPARPAVLASTGVSMYLTKEANAATLREIARLAPVTTLAMSFLLPTELLAEEDRRGSRSASAGRLPRGRRSAASSRRTRSSHWPARQDSPTRGTSHRPIRTHGTSPDEPTGCACPPARNHSWRPRNKNGSPLRGHGCAAERTTISPTLTLFGCSSA